MRSRWLLPILGATAAMLLVLPCEAADEAAALDSFKTIVNNLPAILRVEKQVVKGRDGYALNALEILDMSYDVQRTDSLVSPFIGEANFTIRWHYYSPCSPEARAALRKWMQEGGMPPAIDCPQPPATPEEAQQKEPNAEEDQKATARYAFQDGRWVPKEVEVRRTSPNSAGGNREIKDVYSMQKLSGWALLDSALAKFFETEEEAQQ